jgi:type I restriction enzyme S subunit
VADVWPSNVDKLSVEGERPVRLVNYTDVYYGDRLHPELDLMAATATTDEFARFRLQRGDVILTKDSETADDIGVSAYVDEASEDMVCGYHLSLIRPRGAVGRYLHFALSSTHARRQMSVAATGVTRFGLRTESVGSLLVWLPPKAEQRAIADYLDAETARIDALVAKKQQLIGLLDERRAALLERRLSDELADHARVPVRHIASISGGITLGGSDGGGERERRPYLRVANVQDGYLDLNDVAEIDVTLTQATRFALQPGDVLMLEGNGNPDNLGRGTTWRGEIPGCLHQNHVHAVRPMRSRLFPEFFDLVVRTPFARSQLTGGGGQVSIATLSKSDIAALRIPLPAVARQQAIVENVRSELGTIDDLGCAAVRQIELLAEHRQALITAAVTGEFAVPDAG